MAERKKSFGKVIVQTVHRDHGAGINGKEFLTSLCESHVRNLFRNVLKWQKIGKSLEFENPCQIRAFRYNEDVRKLKEVHS